MIQFTDHNNYLVVEKMSCITVFLSIHLSRANTSHQKSNDTVIMAVVNGTVPQWNG